MFLSKRTLFVSLTRALVSVRFSLKFMVSWVVFGIVKGLALPFWVPASIQFWLRLFTTLLSVEVLDLFSPERSESESSLVASDLDLLERIRRVSEFFLKGCLWLLLSRGRRSELESESELGEGLLARDLEGDLDGDLDDSLTIRLWRRS